MNKLRDSLLGLTSIPRDVKQAGEKTIEITQQSTADTNIATEANNKNVERLNEVITDNKSEI